jgi:hypothetical protein
MTLFHPFPSLFWSRRDRVTGRGRNRRRAHLTIESLEDRFLLSTYFSPETSNTGPAIITFQSQVTGAWAPYIAWKGLDCESHLNVENLYTGIKVTLPDTTTASPALAVYQGRLFLAWTGTDPQHSLTVESSADGVNFSVKTTLGQTTDFFNGPVLAVTGDQVLAIGWTGTDRRLNYALSFDTFGQYWTAAATLPYESWYRPTLSGWNGDFTISWTDLGTNLYRTFSITNCSELPDPPVINLDAPSEAIDDGFPPYTYLGVARTDWTTWNVSVYSNEFGTTPDLGQSWWAPSLAADEIPDYNHFYVAWTGVDAHLYYAVLSDSDFYPGAASQYGPVGATPNRQPNAAWVATDQQLKVLDQVNGTRFLGDPINGTSQNAPSPAADRDLYFAWMENRNAQIQTGDVNQGAARNTGELNDNGPSRATDVAGTPGIAWAGTGEASGLLGGDLNAGAM